mmetsp:Transcript_15893/g.19780  ORF Transcript_15893/g.19780 Transcript_15893/m.19780 type:complete len:237 (+) Transcript_15893:83-793(+)
MGPQLTEPLLSRPLEPSSPKINNQSNDDDGDDDLVLPNGQQIEYATSVPDEPTRKLKFCGCERSRIGKMIVIVSRKDGSPVLILGPLWPFCTFITIPVILVGMIGMSLILIYYSKLALPLWAMSVYFSLGGLTLISLGMVGCRDPGLVERKREADVEAILWNEQVQSYQPLDAHYSRECKVLIQGFDHVCPWTGTAIGSKNIKAFYVFVSCISFLVVSSILLWGFCIAKMIKFSRG